MPNVCYCKKCKLMVKVAYWKIDEKDRMHVTLTCFHEPRIFQLITSSKDYKMR